MSNGYTPGPWESYRFLVCHPLDSVDEDGVPDAEVVATASNDANARLIAAAPDLLADCRAVVEHMRRHDRLYSAEECELYNQLRADIAKATGQL